MSVFIRVHPRPKWFGVCRGALRRALAEFGVKGDKALFLILGILEGRFDGEKILAR